MTTLEDPTPSPLEDATVTPVVLGGVRGGPPVPTLRKDTWWVLPVVTATVLTAFVGYADLGRILEQGLLRRRGPAPEPDLAVLLPLPHGQLCPR